MFKLTIIYNNRILTILLLGDEQYTTRCLIQKLSLEIGTCYKLRSVLCILHNMQVGV